MTIFRTVYLLGAVMLLLGLLGSDPAAADSPGSGGDVSVAQTLGDRELTFVLRRVTAVPGPLRIDVITHVGTAPGSLKVALTPTDASTAEAAIPPGTTTSRGTVPLGATPGSYGATLRVDRVGPWQLAVNDGTRTALVPFVVTTAATSPAEKAVYAGFVTAGALLLVSMLVATRVRRAAWVAVPAIGTVAGLSVALTAAVLSASLPLPPQPGLQTDATVQNATDPYALAKPLTSDYSRPPALLTVQARAPVAGRSTDLTLALTDASTGRPVDDLVVHDDAFLHLLVVGPAGQLWHLHPIRTAPGTYQVQMTLPQRGHYAVSAEVERLGGGVQLLRSASGVTVARGTPTTPQPAPLAIAAGRYATATLAGRKVSVNTTRAVAEAATTIIANYGRSAQLQPWLGMLGHLIVVGPFSDAQLKSDLGTAAQTAPVWAHGHSMGDLSPLRMSDMGDGSSSMAGMSGLMPANGDSAADETVAAFGQSISFTFHFPQAGHYLMWIQAELDYRILTVPISLTVSTS